MIKRILEKLGFKFETNLELYSTKNLYHSYEDINEKQE